MTMMLRELLGAIVSVIIIVVFVTSTAAPPKSQERKCQRNGIPAVDSNQTAPALLITRGRRKGTRAGGPHFSVCSHHPLPHPANPAPPPPHLTHIHPHRAILSQFIKSLGLDRSLNHGSVALERDHPILETRGVLHWTLTHTAPALLVAERVGLTLL